ncbi:MAG TPA: TonB family protein [Novosphingobium sp.]|nr:TonB family protein [Novosphingobium sp.]
MSRASVPAARRPRWGVAGAVLLIHLVVVAGLVRAFTPDLAAQAVRAVTQAFTVELDAPPPPPPASPQPSPSAVASAAAPREEGLSGAEGRKAEPRPEAVPPAPVVVRPTQAPPVAGRGDADSAGAGQRGESSGASGAGSGTGAGSEGSGTGGGGSATPTVKIAGDISSAKDYPRATRELRVGSSVTIDLAVGIEGTVTGCQVVQPSRDPGADAITCALAAKRFRFRPARDSAGKPVAAVYRWRQRWFY